jgi:hypothetical protein
MAQATINKVEVLATGELLLGLEAKGEAWYQHVYRGAAGVYWDGDKNGFKSTPMKEMSASQWFGQIVCVVRSELGVKLVLSDQAAWCNVEDQERIAIQHVPAI